MPASRRSIKSATDLIASGLVGRDEHDAVSAVAARYAVAITPAMNALIRDAGGPIRRQFVPDVGELATHAAETPDPIGDAPHSPVAGIVHRYSDRVLLKIASVCPVYCRFCFRREMVGPQLGDSLSAAQFDEAIAYIERNQAIWEVILTGGDPFVLSPRRIADVTAKLDAIRHVKIIRWHTRVPVVDPGCVTPDLVAALTAKSTAVWIGLHTNHASELTADARSAIARLIGAGFPVISQTVLLRGINDDADALEALMRALVEMRVKPYYLHHGDLAPGTSHFRTTIAEGRALMAELRRRLSGLALPTYVLDIPGGFGKVPIAEGYVSSAPNGYSVRDARGRTHAYDDCCTAADSP